MHAHDLSGATNRSKETTDYPVVYRYIGRDNGCVLWSNLPGNIELEHLRYLGVDIVHLYCKEDVLL
jgi:hypothetical protein